jgi:hypothetical protein
LTAIELADGSAPSFAKRINHPRTEEKCTFFEPDEDVQIIFRTVKVSSAFLVFELSVHTLLQFDRPRQPKLFKRRLIQIDKPLMSVAMSNCLKQTLDQGNIIVREATYVASPLTEASIEQFLFLVE